MIMIRKMTNAVLISMLTGAMAILISGCSNNSTPQSTKSTSASTNTQAASSENTTASDIATTADDSAESVTSIKKDGYLAIPIADLSQTASFYKADLDETEVEIVALKDSNPKEICAPHLMPARFAIALAEGIIVKKVSILYAKTVEIPLQLIR